MSTDLGVEVSCAPAGWLAAGGGGGSVDEEGSATRGDTIASHPCIAAKILVARLISLLLLTASAKDTPSTTEEGVPGLETGTKSSTLMETIEVSWDLEPTKRTLDGEPSPWLRLPVEGKAVWEPSFCGEGVPREQRSPCEVTEPGV